MAAGWSAEETRALITVWGQENVQSQLDTTILPRTRIRTCTSLSCVSHVRSSIRESGSVPRSVNTPIRIRCAFMDPDRRCALNPVVV